jgi:RND family efflux transporter MFP subunit
MSKDVKQIRIGHKSSPVKRAITWILGLAVCGGGGYAAYRYLGTPAKVEVAVARVRKADFIVSVQTRGDVRSVHSEILKAPQIPSPTIVKLAESGRPIRKGEIVVEFDAAQQEQNLLENATNVRTADSEIVQTQASHRMTDEADGMNLMTAGYNVERAKLEASKAEVVSEIEGAKNRIDVGVSEGDLTQVKTVITSHKTTETADLERLDQKKQKTIRDMERSRGYLANMVIRAPIDGIVNILPNFRSLGSFGSAPPPFKEGDKAWTGAPIAEIPDLSEMRIELKLDEVDRGRLQLGQKAKVRVDAVPDRELPAELDWISPIANVMQRGPFQTDKSFPARATLKQLDPRLRPGMSATAEIVIEQQPNRLLIPVRASVLHNGKPAVWVQKGEEFVIREVEVGKRNETDIIVLKGLKEGEVVALENPVDAAKKAKKI